MSSIRISPKYGVNPTIGICFWCGKETNELALMGKLKGDTQAPKYSILSYEPCDECKKILNDGAILLIGATDTPVKESQVPITTDENGIEKYPSCYVFVKDNWADYYLQENVREEVKRKHMCVLPDAFVRNFININQKDGTDNEDN